MATLDPSRVSAFFSLTTWSAGHRTGNHVVQQDLLQLLRIGQQGLDRSLGQLGESLVRGGEDREGALVGQGLFQTGGLDRGDQGGESGVFGQREDGLGCGRLFVLMLVARYRRRRNGRRRSRGRRSMISAVSTARVFRCLLS